MTAALDKVSIKGFKSIKDLDEFHLKNLNVFIGGNGAGKSNFIDFFRLLRAMMELSLPELKDANLRSYITDNGGIDSLLFNGPKITEQMEFELHFGQNGYSFKIAPTSDNEYLINEEKRFWKGAGWHKLGSGHVEPIILSEKNGSGFTGGRNVSSYIYDAIKSWRIYHFHDTSKTAAMKRSGPVEDFEFLRYNASNIATFLAWMKTIENFAYRKIVDTIRLVAPFFDDFILKPDFNGNMSLAWLQKGSDFPMKPNLFSDGTIRFICLATALLQPYPPSTIIIDEPELGLHPYAIDILAELIKDASKKTQVVISTQSPALLNNFDPENIIIVDRINGASTFKNLDSSELKLWLDDYSLGELWQKNIFSGGPVCE